MLEKLKKLFISQPAHQHVSGPYQNGSSASVDSFKTEHPQVDVEVIKLPNMANVTNLKVKKWLVNEGQRVSSGDVLCEVTSDKAMFELESYVDGYVYHRQYPNIQVNTGQVICLVTSEQIS